MLEEQLVDLVVSAMEHSENSDPSSDPDLSHLLWQHLSSQLIYFVLFQFASFPHMVISLYDKVSDFTGFPQALETMENLENHEKSSMHGKIMEFEIKLNNHGKIMGFCEII